jgi:hypothetical protein
MVQTVGAANNGVSNPSTLPSNTAKSPTTATKSSKLSSRVSGKSARNKSMSSFFRAADSCSIKGGSFEELEKLSRVVISGPNPDAAKWGEAMEEGNPHGLTATNLTLTLQPLLENATEDKCRGFCLVGPSGQATVERTKNGFKVMIHELHKNNEFLIEKYAELSDEVTLSILRGLFGNRAASNFLSPGSVSDADLNEPDMTDDEADFKVHHLDNVDIDADVRYSCHHVIDNADPTANLLRKNSIYESFDENVFNEMAGLTEERNRIEPIYEAIGPRDRDTGSVSSIGTDPYTRQWSEIGNTHNDAAQTDASSISLKSGTSTSKIPHTGFAEQTTIEQRMPAANKNNLRVVGPDGLPPTIWDFSSPEGQEKILKCIQDFDQSHTADFEKINQAQLDLEEFQYANPNSASEACMEFVSNNFLQRSNVNNLYEQFLPLERKNLAQAIRKQNEIASSGAEIDGDAALLQPDSIEHTAWSTRVQMAQRIEELTPANTIVERVERLTGRREAFSPSAIKPTAGSALKSSSSVVDINSALRPDESMYIFKTVISSDAMVATTETLNGSESTTTPIPGSPSDFRAGTDFGGVKNIAGKMESVIKKNKSKAAKNTPSKGTAGIQS